MRKSKVAAVTMGMIASVLFGGYAVTDAATVTLDDSTAPEIKGAEVKTAAPEATIKTSPESAAPASQANESISTAPPVESVLKNISRVFVSKKTVKETEISTTPTEAPATTEAPAPTEAISTEPVVTEPVITEEPATEAVQEVTEASETTTKAPARVFIKSVIRSTVKETETTKATETTVAETSKSTETTVTTVAETETLPETIVTETTAEETTVTETTTTETTSETTTTETTVTETEPIITTEVTTIETAIVDNAEIVDVSEIYLDNIHGTQFVETAPAETTPVIVETEAPETTAETPAQSASIGISDSEYILLCNAVAHEAGSDVITIENKAKVVEVIMNRVASSQFPDTIYGVLTQKNQFSGSSTYVNLTTYSKKVTDNVKAAVDLYFSDPSAFSHGYLFFYGDGSQNHFRQS